MKVIVPPVKCQGIKTKLIPAILGNVPMPVAGRWIEPFCGSGVVGLNIHANRATLADSNRHIIELYQAIRDGVITSYMVRTFLEREGRRLEQDGEQYYMEVRTRFNEFCNPLDFLFLNRSCFNGIIRFNSKGKFNVPFCHKPDRFASAYVTKIVNQVKTFAEVLRGRDWEFKVQSFRETLGNVQPEDFVYVDPPYAGRHVDYYNSWTDVDERDLISTLKNLPCRFLLSTWHSNKYRSNPAIQEVWSQPGFHFVTVEHFYHVGSTEVLRNSMTEALVANYPISQANVPPRNGLVTYTELQQALQF